MAKTSCFGKHQYTLAGERVVLGQKGNRGSADENKKRQENRFDKNVHIKKKR